MEKTIDRVDDWWKGKRIQTKRRLLPQETSRG
jgi:hypothetical protein